MEEEALQERNTSTSDTNNNNNNNNTNSNSNTDGNNNNDINNKNLEDIAEEGIDCQVLLEIFVFRIGNHPQLETSLLLRDSQILLKPSSLLDCFCCSYYHRPRIIFSLSSLKDCTRPKKPKNESSNTRSEPVVKESKNQIKKKRKEERKQQLEERKVVSLLSFSELYIRGGEPSRESLSTSLSFLYARIIFIIHFNDRLFIFIYFLFNSPISLEWAM